jgi:integrase/recombinase XerD
MEMTIKGKEWKESLHSQFITELADKGVNVRLVQTAARHKSIAVTMRYIDVNENRLRAAVELVSC